MTDLLPCPFCGGKAYLTASSDGYGVECRNELCVKTIMQEHSTEAEAISAWNTRVDVEHGGIPMTEENMAKHGWVRERTCHVEYVHHDDITDDITTDLSCGHWVDGLPKYINYCPICGSRVIEG